MLFLASNLHNNCIFWATHRNTNKHSIIVINKHILTLFALNYNDIDEMCVCVCVCMVEIYRPNKGTMHGYSEDKRYVCVSVCLRFIYKIWYYNFNATCVCMAIWDKWMYLFKYSGHKPIWIKVCRSYTCLIVTEQI